MYVEDHCSVNCSCGYVVCVHGQQVSQSLHINDDLRLNRKKGAGKTTLLTKFAIQYMQKGWKVFSNVEIFGCYRMDPNDFGFVQYPPNSLILIDEVSLIWDNRSFKTFKKEVGQYLRLIRHFRNKCIFFSQTFDTDKKIRDMCDQLYLCTNLFGFISIARKIKKTPTLHNSSRDDDGNRTSEGFITDDFSFYPPTQWIWTYIPRWIKFFNSFETDPMPHANRRKYRFINEPYLYKLTHYPFYKKDQLNDLKMRLKKNMHENKYSFDLSFFDYNDLNDMTA